MDSLDRKAMAAILSFVAKAQSDVAWKAVLREMEGWSSDQRERFLDRFPVETTSANRLSILRKRLFETSSETFGVCVLVTHHSYREEDYGWWVLMVNRRGLENDLAMPGGHVESGEKPVTSARRELAEETGVSILDLGDPIYGGYDAHGNWVLMYHVELPSKECVREREDGITPRWVRPPRLFDKRNSFAPFYLAARGSVDFPTKMFG